MNMSNCPRCRKLAIIPSGAMICDPCTAEEAKMLEKVRDHLKDNPGLTLLELAKETAVSPKRIESYIRGGKIELAEPSINCQKCQTKIMTGKFCEECAESFSQHSAASIMKMKEQAQREKGMAMHIDAMKKR